MSLLQVSMPMSQSPSSHSQVHKQLDLNWKACKLRWRQSLGIGRTKIECLTSSEIFGFQLQGRKSKNHKERERQEKLSNHFVDFCHLLTLWIRKNKRARTRYYFDPCRHRRMPYSSHRSYSLLSSNRDTTQLKCHNENSRRFHNNEDLELSHLWLSCQITSKQTKELVFIAILCSNEWSSPLRGNDEEWIFRQAISTSKTTEDTNKSYLTKIQRAPQENDR
jgi:hypothetical protein